MQVWLRTMLVNLLAAALLLGAAPGAPAQARTCNFPRDAIIGSLAGRFGEVQHGVGLTKGGGHIIELWTSDGGKTWTIMIMSPYARGCILVSGDAWLDIEKPPEPTH